MKTTYFAVQSFIPGRRGAFSPSVAVECLSAMAADRIARRLALEKGGAVAFSRVADPEVGVYDDAIIIAFYGEVPAEAIAA